MLSTTDSALWYIALSTSGAPRQYSASLSALASQKIRKDAKPFTSNVTGSLQATSGEGFLRSIQPRVYSPLRAQPMPRHQIFVASHYGRQQGRRSSRCRRHQIFVASHSYGWYMKVVVTSVPLGTRQHCVFVAYLKARFPQILYSSQPFRNPYGVAVWLATEI